MGLNISTICYHFGSLNEKTLEFIRKFYRAGRTTDFSNQVKLAPIDTHNVFVTPLGAWFDSWSGFLFSINSLKLYKYQVEKAIE